MRQLDKRVVISPKARIQEIHKPWMLASAGMTNCDEVSGGERYILR